MNTLLLKKIMLATTLGVGLSLANVGSTTAPDDGEPPPPKTGDCSPGFYKNHIDFWWGIYCDASPGATECSDLLTALTCKGADAICGRNAAAATLNAASGCTED